MIRCILDTRAQFLLRDDSGFTPLHYAAHTGKEEMVKLFFLRGHNAYCTRYSGVRLDRRSRAGNREDALTKGSDGICGIDRAATSISDSLSFVV
ncbi:hypothetical protein AJ79_07865 [Helicocarpus griseus UAMH5409]|uniref:Uncharacterized protein n=1 Tax=Helicocarpus griseus UAMH5409 TaxID=1447875 RepID=A0A2B7WYG5_9EURO|nr:hypothetical protein AJ79_07865 [Helicocarpus griseus UAMH5409]